MFDILECYFDDSSDPRSEKYCACGGLMGGQDQWDLFHIMWAHETSELKQPFRATECECGYGQFEGWPREKRVDLMARLVEVIRKFKLYGFASIVPIAEFRDAFPTLNHYDAFILAVTQTIMNMADIADDIDLHAELWFELGPKNAAIANRFNQIKSLDWKPARRLRALHLAPKELRPLQSADLIAREAFKHMDNFGMRPTRIPVRRMASTLYFVLWTTEALKYLAAQGGPNDHPKLLTNFDATAEARKLKHFWKKF